MTYDADFHREWLPSRWILKRVIDTQIIRDVVFDSVGFGLSNDRAKGRGELLSGVELRRRTRVPRSD
jgi:hypothetical protein|tara:strand:+ start:1052 stop:1252 length:201 start_codon:yes stop_codon:yes gene_type:complete